MSNEHLDMSGNPCDFPLTCEQCGKDVREDRVFGSLQAGDVILCSAQCVFDYDNDAEVTNER